MTVKNLKLKKELLKLAETQLIAFLRTNEPLSKHCTYRIGGLAELFMEIKNLSILPQLFKIIKKYKIPYFFFGRGSNILFLDQGFEGIVIRNLTNGIEINGAKISVDSGVEMGKLLNKLREANLTGLENLLGIPGTIGGAVFGNAGRKEIEIAERVMKVEYFDIKSLKFKIINQKKCKFGYRESIFKKHPDWIITRVYLKLRKANKKEIDKKQEEMMEKLKKRKYPKGFSCGSFFKNPSSEMPAGKLIEECGLKGCRIGDAKISEEHGNFIMNMGKAKARDILKLAELAEKKVKNKFGIKLEREVRVV